MRTYSEITYLRRQIRMYEAERLRYEQQGFKQCAKHTEEIISDLVDDLVIILIDLDMLAEDDHGI